jgi:hypothetical protein
VCGWVCDASILRVLFGFSLTLPTTAILLAEPATDGDADAEEAPKRAKTEADDAEGKAAKPAGEVCNNDRPRLPSLPHFCPCFLTLATRIHLRHHTSSCRCLNRPWPAQCDTHPCASNQTRAELHYHPQLPITRAKLHFHPQLPMSSLQ